MFYGKYTLSVFRALMQPCTWCSWQYNNAYSIKTISFLLVKGQDKTEYVHEVMRATMMDKEQTFTNKYT
jgi:hypothetical protein